MYSFPIPGYRRIRSHHLLQLTIFPPVLEDRVETIAELKEMHGTAGKMIARFTRYDLLPSHLAPESINEDSWVKATLISR